LPGKFQGFSGAVGGQPGVNGVYPLYPESAVEKLRLRLWATGFPVTA
jgi:hypothetical protein